MTDDPNWDSITCNATSPLSQAKRSGASFTEIIAAWPAQIEPEIR